MSPLPPFSTPHRFTFGTCRTYHARIILRGRYRTGKSESHLVVGEWDDGHTCRKRRADHKASVCEPRSHRFPPIPRGPRQPRPYLATAEPTTIDNFWRLGNNTTRNVWRSGSLTKLTTSSPVRPLGLLVA